MMFDTSFTSNPLWKKVPTCWESHLKCSHAHHAVGVVKEIRQDIKDGGLGED